jgi:hypothetical protein
MKARIFALGIGLLGAGLCCSVWGAVDRAAIEDDRNDHPGPLHAMDEGMEVHQWIAWQAYILWTNQVEGSELERFLTRGADGHPVHLTGNWQSIAESSGCVKKHVSNPLRRDSLIMGTADEDRSKPRRWWRSRGPAIGSAPPIILRYNEPWPFYFVEHFINGTRDDNGAWSDLGLNQPQQQQNMSSFIYNMAMSSMRGDNANLTEDSDRAVLSAYGKAQRYWNGGVQSLGTEQHTENITWGVTDLYSLGGTTKARAYWHLGLVAHLLMDMTVPTHVHGTPHGGKEWLGWVPGLSGGLGGTDFYETWVSANGRFQNYSHASVVAPRSNGTIRSDYLDLRELFRETADYTCAYPSNYKEGYYERWGNYRDTPKDWHAADHKPHLVTRTAYTNDADDAMGHLIATDLMAWAIRQTANLYALFYRAVDHTPPLVSFAGIEPAGAIHPVNEPIRIRIEAKDPESGIFRDSVQMKYRRRAIRSSGGQPGSWSAWYDRDRTNHTAMGNGLHEVEITPIHVAHQYEFAAVATNGAGLTGTNANSLMILVGSGDGGAAGGKKVAQSVAQGLPGVGVAAKSMGWEGGFSPHVITGWVTRADTGAGVAEARIDVRERETGYAWSVLTDSSGHYVAEELYPGFGYELSAELQGNPIAKWDMPVQSIVLSNSNFKVDFVWTGNYDFQWSTFLYGGEAGASTDETVIEDAAIAPDGSVYMVGHSSRPGWTAGGATTEHGGERDGFVLKTSTNGTHLWSAFVGGSTNDTLVACATDTNGNLYAVGNSDSLDWLGLGETQGWFVVKWNAAGGREWITGATNHSTGAATDIDVDAEGNCHIAGSFMGGAYSAVAWNSGNYTEQIGGTAQMLKLDSDGTVLYGILHNSHGGTRARIRVFLGGDYIFADNFVSSNRILRAKGMGRLRVTMDPGLARDLGAKWRIVGSQTWFESGKDVWVPVGEYEIEFKDVYESVSGGSLLSGTATSMALIITNSAQHEILCDYDMTPRHWAGRYTSSSYTDLGGVLRPLTGSLSGGTLYGTDIYRDTSPSGYAAVHAGVLDNGQFGLLRAYGHDPRRYYAGSLRYGVQTYDYDGGTNEMFWRAGYSFGATENMTVEMQGEDGTPLSADWRIDYVDNNGLNYYWSHSGTNTVRVSSGLSGTLIPGLITGWKVPPAASVQGGGVHTFTYTRPEPVDMEIWRTGMPDRCGQHSMAVDSEGAIYAAYHAYDEDINAKLVRISPEGVILWNRPLEGVESDSIKLALLNDGRLFLLGHVRDPATLKGQPELVEGGVADAEGTRSSHSRGGLLLAEYDGNGDRIRGSIVGWGHYWTYSGYGARFGALAIDGQERIYLGGPITMVYTNNQWAHGGCQIEGPLDSAHAYVKGHGPFVGCIDWPDEPMDSTLSVVLDSSLAGSLPDARWSIDGGGTWQDNGTTVEIPTGLYELTFNEIADHAVATNRWIVVRPDQPNRFTVTYQMHTGRLQVNITDQNGASFSSGRWRVVGNGWQSDWTRGGQTVRDIPVGDYTVEFLDVNGWSRPDPIAIEIEQYVTSSDLHVRDVVYSSGQLRVVTTPAGGKRWYVTGRPETYYSGNTAILPPGTYQIQFLPFSGWVEPSPFEVTVIAGELAERSAFYTTAPQYGELRVDIPHWPARQAGARWRLSGESFWRESGTAQKLETGVYTVEFKEAPGWVTPDPVSAEIHADDITVASGNYANWTGLPDEPMDDPATAGALRVELEPVGAGIAGARWRVNGGVWRQSGDETRLPPGSYTLDFTHVHGWRAPPSCSVTIATHATNNQVAVYETFASTEAIDYFTEEFGAQTADLEQLMLTLVPNDESPSFYSAYTDPVPSGTLPPLDEGEAVEFGTESWGYVSLANGKSVSLYGMAYTGLYVNANGSITFDGPDAEFAPTLASHFQQPRISIFSAPWIPQEGEIRWQQEADRVVVFYSAESLWSGYESLPGAGQSTFQAELFFDGRICLTWWSLAWKNGVSGISSGQNLDASRPAQTDLGDLAGYGTAGDVFRFKVIGDISGVIRGSNPYTLDSPLATAAVHYGYVQPDEVGVVIVERQIPTWARVWGSCSNGVCSLDGYQCPSFGCTYYRIIESFALIGSDLSEYPPLYGETGRLQVDLTPDDAIGWGATWRISGGDRQLESGTSLLLSTGIYQVVASDIPGPWATPVPVMAEVFADQTSVVNRAYGAESARVAIQLEPTNVIAAGAQWKLDDGIWRGSGETVWVEPGPHEVRFRSVRPHAPYEAPANAILNLNAGDDVLGIYPYAMDQGGVQVQLLPAEAAQAGAWWRVAGGEWHESGASVQVNVGEQTVEFLVGPGWRLPDPIQIVVEKDSPTVLQVEFESQELVEILFEVASTHGDPIPSAGEHAVYAGAIITNWLRSAAIEDGLVQYVPSGHQVSGGEVLASTMTSVVVCLTNDAVLRWKWTTNYWLSAGAAPHGTVDAVSGWQEADSLAEIEALPDLYYEFARWLGVGGEHAGNNPLELTMDAPRSVTALFGAQVTEGTGTPLWWLADQGWTEDLEVAALEDPDEDGMLNWEEEVAGTDPKDPESYLRHDEVAFGEMAFSLVWPSVAGRTYQVQYSTNLTKECWVSLPEAEEIGADPPVNRVEVAPDALPELHRMFRVTVQRAESPVFHMAVYLAGPNGSVEGASYQEIPDGESGTAVEAVPVEGYRFVRWSDGAVQNPRVDSGLAEDIHVTAEFAPE